MQPNADNESLISKIANSDFPIVGVGASAGGLEALEQFFQNVTPDSGLAYVVIQHLSPDYKSLMAELLAKHTTMPIYRAVDGIEIKANSIYLIPPKKNMTVFHRKLYLTEQNHSLGLNLPIDIFLRSLAEDLGEMAIGIILSGTGSDGTLGVRAIKGAGGMIMVQEESSAKFDGMPRSAIATGLVDYILPPDKMGEQLLKFISHPLAVRQDVTEDLSVKDDDVLSKILASIRNRCGVDFTFYKPNTIIRRIERRISVHQLSSISEYSNFLSEASNEVNILYKELLIGVTKFFRDNEAFEILNDKVIPEIFKSKKNMEPIRVWISGCSTGEEAYSIAILFKEYMDAKGIYNDVKIFATDIDKDAIEIASSGNYPESIVADISDERLRKFFFKNNNSFKVTESIRQMVIFATHNLIKDPPFSKIDLISCRNLLIYLQPVMQKKVLSTFSFALNANSFLFLGTSESIGDLSHYFSSLDSKWKIYKNNESIKQSIIDDIYIPRLRSRNIPNYREIKSVSKVFDGDMVDKINKNLFEQYVPPSIIVNDRFELLHVSKDASKFLKVPSGKISYNIQNMVNQELSVAIGTAIHRVIKENSEVVYTNISLIVNGDEKSLIDLIVKPFRDDKTKNTLILIIFDEKSIKESSSDSSSLFDINKNASQRILDLENELKYTKENLQATIEELETSNEELQATNEELIASNEELQSTNEELQSVNEELYTVNSEYQSKIEELTELNNDINNWFNVTNIGTIFLDLKLRIRKFTPSTKDFINLIENDMGRPIKHISYNFDYESFFDDIDDVLKTLAPKDKEIKIRNGKWVSIKILPYRTTENAVKGIVITFLDISKIKAADIMLIQEQILLATILDNNSAGILIIDELGNIKFHNKIASEIIEYDLNSPNYSSLLNSNWKFLSKSLNHQHLFDYMRHSKTPLKDFKIQVKENEKEVEIVANVSNIYKDEIFSGAVISFVKAE